MEKAIHVLPTVVEQARKKLSIAEEIYNLGARAVQGMKNALYVLLIVAE